MNRRHQIQLNQLRRPAIKRAFKLLIAGQLERYVQRLLRRNPKLKTVAVGGSVGKTSTKLAIATVLKQKFRVHYQDGNFNDPISIPLSILGLEIPNLYNPLSWIKTFQAASTKAEQPFPFDMILLELGTDQPGDIPHFMKFLKPDIGVVTATTPEHIEMFKSLEAVVTEEFALAQGSRVAILNADDEGLKANLKKLSQKVITYGEGGTVHFADRQTSPDGGITGTLCLDTETISVKSKVVARHSLYALMAAAAVGRELGMTKADIAAGLEDFTPVAGRMNPLLGVNDSLILDDSYNASPDAVIAALQTLTEVAKVRAIAILGNMNELGGYSRQAHEQVGAACGDLDMLVTIGQSARDFIVPEAKKAGLKADQINSFMSPYEAGEFVKRIVRGGDTVLVKGSQNGVFSEEAAALLLRNSSDRSKLVRQSPDWLAKKQAQFNHHE